MHNVRRLSLLLPLSISLLVMFVASASGAQIVSVTHTFQPRIAGSNTRNAILTRRCLNARFHWLTAEELTPRPAKFGPWRYNQASDGCTAHYPYINMTSETVKICVGASDATLPSNVDLYEHDNNNCQVCTRSQNGAGNALICNEVFSLFGRVTDVGGEPLAWVQIGTGAGQTAVTDANGHYTFSNLLKGEYTLTPLGAGESFSPTIRIVSVASSYNVRGLDFTSLPAIAPPPTSTTILTVSGRIVDADGSPMAGVMLTASSGAVSASDQEGRYLLSDLISETLIITPTRPGVDFSPPSRRIELTATVNAIDFAAANRYSITGRIVDATGAGIPDAQVSCSTIGATFFVRSDQAGVYRCGDLERGLHLVGFGERKAGWFIVPPGRSTVNFALTATEGGVAGRMIDANSRQPVTGAEVIAVEPGVRSLSAADGAYSLRLPLGVHTLRVAAPGYLDLSTPVSVTVGVTKSLDVALKPVPVDGFRLPYPAGSEYLCLQANNQDPTHRGNWIYAFDFAVPLGKPVAAARAGRVITVVDHYRLTCTENTSACRNAANYIRIRHVDGTDTLYYHLDYKSALVKASDWVTAGQNIATSGKTGLVLGPVHLDFSRHRAAGWVSIPVSFLDVAESDGKPRRNKLYRSQNPSAVEAAEIAAMMEMPPQGSVSLSVAQTRTLQARFDPVGMAADVTDLRLAETPEALEQSDWMSVTPSVEWSAPAIFAQFRDAAGLVSPPISDTLLALVYTPITPTFTVSPTVCVGDPLPIENHTTPYCTQCGWQWDFGNGVKSSQIEPLFDNTGASSFFGYAEPGLYTVTLTVTNYYSQSAFSHSVQALPTPSADFSLWGEGAAITATASYTDALSWAWRLGDETVTTTTPTLIFANPFTATENSVPFFIGLTVRSANGCQASSEQLALVQRSYLPIITQQSEEQQPGEETQP